MIKFSFVHLFIFKEIQFYYLSLLIKIFLIQTLLFIFFSMNIYASSFYIIDKTGIKFVKIGPESFLMGSPKNEKGRKDDEKLHKVTLTRGFYISVTVKLLKENGSR